MTKGVNIIADSCADFNPDIAKRLGIEIIGFPYVFQGVEHIDDLWQSIDPHEFYEGLRAGNTVTTSAVSPGRYYEVFKQAAEKGTPTLYLGFTEGLSSSLQAAHQAAQLIKDEYPEFELYILDNLCPSAAAELLAIEAVRQAANGLSAEELYAWCKDARYFIQGYFTLENFDSLAAGGRIPAAAAQIGGKLDIKPELSYDLNGSLTLCGMCRGRRKALRAILAEFKQNYSGDVSLPIAIVSSDAQKDAEWLEAAIRKEPGCANAVVLHSSISPVIGSHVGPGMVALVFWGKDRREATSLTDRLARKVRSRTTEIEQ